MDGIIADKCREVKYILVVFYNKEIIREKSVRKKARCKQMQGLKIRCGKVKLT